jgi:hypothetical protein
MVPQTRNRHHLLACRPWYSGTRARRDRSLLSDASRPSVRECRDTLPLLLCSWRTTIVSAASRPEVRPMSRIRSRPCRRDARATIAPSWSQEAGRHIEISCRDATDQPRTASIRPSSDPPPHQDWVEAHVFLSSSHVLPYHSPTNIVSLNHPRSAAARWRDGRDRTAACRVSRGTLQTHLQTFVNPNRSTQKLAPRPTEGCGGLPARLVLLCRLRCRGRVDPGQRPRFDHGCQGYLKGHAAQRESLVRRCTPRAIGRIVRGGIINRG